ncbi:MAG: hypothetical protein ACJ8AS_05815 [Hyphomicrobiales bacterium]
MDAPMDGAEPGLRPAGEVMRLARLGASFPTRLSFMRALVRRMSGEGWRFRRTRFGLDRNGYGECVWTIDMPSGPLSFLAFSTALSPEERTDRVIAEKWDASFALLGGEASAEDIERLARNVPRQEAGRCEPRDLVMSRANRSVRLFDYVVERLASGTQPDMRSLLEVGYLMRTTAVYGNGKFGLGDFARVRAHPELDGPYRAEMLIVYMIRQFQFDLVEHIARVLGGASAVALAHDRRRALGIGNATGLGMAPFLIRHPILIDRWIGAREEALRRARSVRKADSRALDRYRVLLERAIAHAWQWNVEDLRQQGRIDALRRELANLRPFTPAAIKPWDSVYTAAESKSIETQELVAALLIEIHPELVDDLADQMGTEDFESIDGRITVAEARLQIEHYYQWAIALDFSAEAARKYFWYYSEGKEEPRLGQRFAEPGAEREMRLGMGLYVQDLYRALQAEQEEDSVAELLLRRPEFRLAMRRLQTTARHPYAEIHDNTIGEGLLPIDLLRAKLAMFGASKFDPKSDLWTRITMYQGAPSIDELASPDADDWWLPVFAE